MTDISKLEQQINEDVDIEDYDLDIDRENALLQDEDEEEDVLSLNPEDDLNADSLLDELDSKLDGSIEIKQRSDKFQRERPIIKQENVLPKTTKINKSESVKKLLKHNQNLHVKHKGHKYRQLNEVRPIKRNKTVLINPRFQGTVHVNSSPTVWDGLGQNVLPPIKPWLPESMPTRVNQSIPQMAPGVEPYVPLNQQQMNFQPPPPQQNVIYQHVIPQQINQNQQPPIQFQTPPPWNGQYQFIASNSCSAQQQISLSNRNAAPVHQRLGIIGERQVCQSVPQNYNDMAPPLTPYNQNNVPNQSYLINNLPQQQTYFNQPQFEHYPSYNATPQMMPQITIQQPIIPPQGPAFNGDNNQFSAGPPQNNFNNQPDNFYNQQSPSTKGVFRPNKQFKRNTFGQNVTNVKKRIGRNFVPKRKDMEKVEKLEKSATSRTIPSAIPEDEDEETRQYRLKIEEQKRKREEILRQKEERRKQLAKESGSTENLSKPTEQNAAPIPVISQQIRNPHNKPSHYSSPNIVITGDDQQYRRNFGANRNVANRNRNAAFKTVVGGDQNRRVSPWQPPSVWAQPVERGLSENSTGNSHTRLGGESNPFLSNRTVVTKEAPLPNTPVVVIKNLSSSTTNARLVKMGQGVGEIQNLQLDKEERQATVEFKSVASAHQFFKKYRRYMLDLSMIEVCLKLKAE